jgi:hypothetical protein
MPDEILPAPVDDNLKVLELRAQWAIPGRAGGESRWRFVMLRSGIFDQQTRLWEMWRDHLKVFFMNHRQGNFTLEQVIVRDLWPATAPDLVQLVGESFGGSEGLEGPPQAGPIITWRSDFRGRSYRGRTFWGPIGINHMESGQYDHAVAVNLDDFAFTLLDVFSLGHPLPIEPNFIIFSQQHNLMPDLPGRYAPVTSYYIPRYLATQRRRQRYYHP